MYDIFIDQDSRYIFTALNNFKPMMAQQVNFLTFYFETLAAQEVVGMTSIFQMNATGAADKMLLWNEEERENPFIVMTYLLEETITRKVIIIVCVFF